ncbi:glucosaminidase domain-containing protein [Streptococcus sp. DD12]|uniref:glucosaminidase domain-containing protein n=1 Tax=Streptococcus sp. DD12 TaxID=1777880 RepID=UPI000795C7B8|nr:glucosaminidase domain-containing protein [Streptococcus sp. DD12]KXT75693.1 Peptidoglycan hydrolase, Autolysin2 [Streptococcus sp. DD12]
MTSHRKSRPAIWSWLTFGLVICLCAGILYQAVSQSLVKKSLSEAEKARQTRLAFIKQIIYPAQGIAEKNDLYTSVMIAQAVLESDSGQSKLSKAPAYNYFGIKGAYKGQAVKYWTWEDDGTGKAYEVQADFKSYGAPANAFSDYAAFLDWPNYRGVHRAHAKTYQDATKALTGVYATDTSYNSKLNRIIKAYGLTLFDKTFVPSWWVTKSA